MFTYRIITTADGDDVVDHLIKYFKTEEPLTKSLNLGECSLEAQQRWRKSIEHNVSVMAVDDKGKVAGVMLNKILSVDDSKNWSDLYETIEDKRLKAMYGLLVKLYDGVNVFEQLQVAKVFYNDILSVNPMYQRQGLGKELYSRSEEVARNMNFQWTISELTGIYSQKIFKKYGFEVIKELNYADYVDDGGQPILDIEQPHTKIQLVKKKLM